MDADRITRQGLMIARSGGTAIFSWFFLVLGISGLTAQTIDWKISLGRPVLSVISLLIAVPLSTVLLFGGRDSAKSETSSASSSRYRLCSFPQGISLFFALLSAVGLLSSALRYSGRTSYGVNIFSQFSGEDSAKWINVVSDYSLGGSEGLGSVGGVTATLLILSRFAANAICLVLGNPVDTVGSTALAVSIAHWVLIAAAPLALLPMFGGERARGEKKYDVAVVSAFSSVLLTVGSFMAAAFGHLTAQILLVGLAFAASVAQGYGPGNRASAMRLARVLALLVMSSWLPFQPLIALCSLILFIQIVRRMIRDRSYPAVSVAEGFAVGIIGLSTVSSLQYIKYNDLGDRLAAAGGGTNAASAELLLLLGVTLGASLFLLKRDSLGWSNEALVIWGMLALNLYALALRFNDIRVNTAMNYGSIKLLWILAVLCTSVGVPLVAKNLDLKSLAGSPLRLGSLFVVLAVPTLGANAQLLNWVNQFRSERWIPVAESVWYSPGVIPPETPLESAPIGCVVREQVTSSVVPQYNSDSYLCTRFLASYAGIENLELIWHGLGVEWDIVSSRLEGRPEIGMREVLVLDKNSQSLGRLTLVELLSMTD
jgi:hypothetical protein